MNCNLCAHNCNVDRSTALGACKCSEKIKLALVDKFMWEEPCISGSNGSGAIFFSGCNLKCIYCQNYEISHENFGKEISIERFAKIMLELQDKKVNNINLVSPTPYVPKIIDAIKIAKNNGLAIPIVYNTGNYENIDTIKSLEGFVDIYLPDLKYYSNETALKYSNAPNYFEIATRNIKEMIRQQPINEIDNNGVLKKGVIIRHLVLPSHITETKHILEWIKTNLDEDVYVSIMMQYFPTYKAKEDSLINRKVSLREYNYVKELSKQFKNGFIQELSNCEEEYVPKFDLSGI